VTQAYVNRIATAVPRHDVHKTFLRFADTLLSRTMRSGVFERMAKRAGIDHRYSVLEPAPDANGPVVDAEGFYRRSDFPSTGKRMRCFEAHAPHLAAEAVRRLALGGEAERITHLVVTCCTGLSAPGLDLEIVERCGLRPGLERTFIGFMGCYAAINALKVARHIVRSEPEARVLVVNLELCTLHLQETQDLEKILSFLLWGDGCAAALVTAEPKGFELLDFHTVVTPESRALITWNVGDQGFDMVLSGQVPAAIQTALAHCSNEILAGTKTSEVDLWAVHPGGRTVLDAVERALDLPQGALASSREVLRRFGNMSSATVMFVLEALLGVARRGDLGCGMSFGPGLVAETMRFRAV
jgi:predicted naringenin-chalcone synthase